MDTDSTKLGRERPATEHYVTNVTNVTNNFFVVGPEVLALGNTWIGASAGPKDPARGYKGTGAGAR